MGNIKEILLSVTYTDDAVSRETVLGNTIFNDNRLEIKIKNECSPNSKYNEIVTEITAKQDIAVRYIDISFILDEAFLNDKLVYFYNGWLTNDWVENRKYIGNTDIIGRDITLLKNTETGDSFFAGYITANRFWTYIKFDKNAIVFRHFMEDKIIPSGKSYVLERILNAYNANEFDYLEHYGNRIAEIYNIKLDKPMPTGWCSWSCFYKNINQDNVTDATEGLFNTSAKMNLLQLDDGWQDESEQFSGEWVEDRKKFPEGLRSFADKLNSQGINLGLWLAPTLPWRNSKFTDNLTCELWKPQPGTSPEILEKIAKNPPRYDIGKPEVLEHYKRVFKRLREECGATYYKLDFLFDTIRIDIENEQFVTFENDYFVAAYRKMLMAIREGVGQDAFMLACGAPILECAGIFDGSRIAPDIVWPKGVGEFSSWTIVKRCIVNVLLRYFYHNKLFYGDADGVILRDYDIGDGFDGSYHEVRAWATAAAISGGLILQNDINRMISPARKKIFYDLFPTNTRAFAPVDFFEMPYPTQSYLDVAPDAKMLAVFNLDENRRCYTVSFEKLGLKGKYIVINAWEKRIIGVFGQEYTEPCLLPHSAEMYLIKQIPEKPEFVFMNNNLFLGQDMVKSSYNDGKLIIGIEEKAEQCADRDIYFFVPNGFECDNDTVYTFDEGKIHCVKGPVACGETVIFIKEG